MSTPTKSYAYAEFAAGSPGCTDYAGVRIIYADKIALEKTARARGWKEDQHAVTISAFLAWHAGKRTGSHDLDYPAFLTAIIDAGLDQEPREAGEVEPDDASVDGLDPTQPAASITPLSPSLSGPVSPPTTGSITPTS